MYDHFDMACHDASSALRLNIKVNSENLMPSAQKYNVGSLRLPADPSWPKIPQRRLADDLDGIIEPPCVVTLTGTSRKTRTTVRSSHCHQFAKPSNSKDQVPASFNHVYHKIPPTTHPLKRRPGCADPRFKRVTTVKSEVASSDQPNRDDHAELSHSAIIIPNQTQSANENVRKTVPEKDTHPPKLTQREAEKPGEIRGMDSIGVQTVWTEEYSTVDDPKIHTIDDESSDKFLDSKKIFDDAILSENLKFSPSEIVDRKIIAENSIDDANILTDLKSCDKRNDSEALIVGKIDRSKEEFVVSGSTTTVPNASVNSQSESTCLQYCQSNAGQFFLVVENKSQASSLSALQIDPSPVPQCQYTTQCYNVQVPVLTYKNLPLQLSTQSPTKVDIPSQLSLSPVIAIPSTPSLTDPAKNHFDDTVVNTAQASESKFEFGPSTSNPRNSDKTERSDTDVDDKKKSLVADEKLGKNSLDTKTNKYSSPNHRETEKNRFASDPTVREATNAMKILPIDVPTKYNDDRNVEDVRAHQLTSDTTDSELYSIEAKRTKPNRDRRRSEETIYSGSDGERNSDRRSKFNDDFSLLADKRRKPLNSTVPKFRRAVCSKHFKERFSRTAESSMDDRESIETRDVVDRPSRIRRKIKSEQNLSRYTRFGEKNYKNVSDSHLAVRESRGIDGKSFDPLKLLKARREREDPGNEKIFDGENRDNPETTDRTTDVDSDAANAVRGLRDDRLNDVGKIADGNKSVDSGIPGRTTALPEKTQRLLTKSYMEYYEKLRSSGIDGNEDNKQRRGSQMAITPLKKRCERKRSETVPRTTKIDEQRQSIDEKLTLEKFSALSNIINRNLNPALQHSCDGMQTTHLYVNENMKSSSDPTAGTETAVVKKFATVESGDIYDSSVRSTLIDRLNRKREKPAERSLLKLKTIAFFGFMMYAMIVLLPLMYNFFLYDEYEDYEDLSYIEIMLDYVVSSCREAFGGLFDAINDLLFRPVSLD